VSPSSSAAAAADLEADLEAIRDSLVSTASTADKPRGGAELQTENECGMASLEATTAEEACRPTALVTRPAAPSSSQKITEQALPNIFDSPAYTEQKEPLPVSAPASPKGDGRPRIKVEDLARSPEYLGLHEVNSEAVFSVPHTELEIAVEMQLGSKQPMLRMKAHQQCAVVVLEPTTVVDDRKPLPQSYHTVWSGPYRLRPLWMKVEKVEESLTGPSGEALSFSTEVVKVLLAIDRPQSTAGSQTSSELSIGESRRLWLSTAAMGCQRHSFNGIDAQLDIGLHPVPLCCPGKGDEPEARFLWSVGLDMMSTGVCEGHGAFELSTASQGQSFTVGEYRVTVKKIHSPLSRPDTSGMRAS